MFYSLLGLHEMALSRTTTRLLNSDRVTNLKLDSCRTNALLHRDKCFGIQYGTLDSFSACFQGSQSFIKIPHTVVSRNDIKKDIKSTFLRTGNEGNDCSRAMDERLRNN